MFCIPAGYFFSVLIFLIIIYVAFKSTLIMVIGVVWTLYYIVEFITPCSNYNPPNKPYWPTEHGLFSLND